MSQVLYSRCEDGAKPVSIKEDSKGLRRFSVGGKTYKTKTELLVALTGHPTGRNWGFNRYFGLGRYASTSAPGMLEMFSAPSDRTIVLPHTDLAPTILTLVYGDDITVADRTLHAAPLTPLIVRSASRGPGIDLAKRGHEVKKLLFAGFGRRIHAAGYDPDDVLQYVYMGILARNRGKCPWDPAKSSFGHYVHMVCGCLLANYHRKQRTIQSHEQLGLRGYTDDGVWGYMDVASAQEATGPTAMETWHEMSEVGADLVCHMRGKVPDKDLNIVEAAMPYLVQGRTRKETAALLGISPPTLSRSLALLSKHGEGWRDRLYC